MLTTYQNRAQLHAQFATKQQNVIQPNVFTDITKDAHMEFDLSNVDKPQRIQAEFRSKCAACGEWIEEDDWIIKDADDNWIHEGCDE